MVNPLLAVALYPLVIVVRGVDVCRRAYYSVRPREFDWLAMDGVVERLRGLCASTATAVEWSYSKSATNETCCVVAERGKFTEAMEICVLARIRPEYVPKQMFLQQLHDQIVDQRELFRGPYWQVGVDEFGRLTVQLTTVAVDTREPVLWERATVGSIFRIK